MGDLKPLGSEKLNGDDKLKRILELTYYNSTPKKSTSNNTKSEMIKESVGNGVYGIVKERDGYYVKKGLNENSLDYIGGLFMKNKNRFSSYAEALKRMDLLVGQENLHEATKYVLKQKSEGGSPAPEGGVPAPDMGGAPTPEVEAPAPDMGGAPSPEGGDAPTPEGDEVPFTPEGGEVPSDEGSGGKPSDYMAEVQKFAGKLGQELRDQKAKMESDDIKYVLNMIISAVDLEKLEDEDIEEIGKKFDRDGSQEGGEEPVAPEGEEEPPMEPEGGEEPVAPEGDQSVPPAPGEEELGETMDKLESFINTPINVDEVNLDDYNDLSISEEEDDVLEVDLEEIKADINKSIGETLSKYFK
jgi:hypothetical protein